MEQPTVVTIYARKQDAAMLRATASRKRRLGVEHPEDAAQYERQALELEAQIAATAWMERAA